jgi:hypothetical protein
MTVPSSVFDKLNIPLNIISDEGRTQDSQGGAGVAIQHGAHILYAIRDNNNYVSLLLNNITDYQRTGRFESLNTWVKISLADRLPESMRKACKADHALSIAAIDEYVYLFWRSPDAQHRVLRTRPDMITQLEVATVSLPDVDGAIISNLAAFPMPATHPSLAGKLGVVALTNPVGTTNTVMIARVLDPATFAPREAWQAQDLSGGTIVFLGGDDTAAKYDQLTASWLDQGLIRPAKDQAPRPYVTLAIHTHNTAGKSPSILSYGMDLVATFDAEYRYKTGADIDLTPIPGLESAGSLGATFFTTPDGQLWTRYTQNHQTRAAKLELDTVNARTPGLHQPRWKPTDDYEGTTVKAKAYNTPFSLFLPLAPTKGRSPCKVMPPVDSAGNTASPRFYENCTLQTFVECVLASDERHAPQMSTFVWGQTFRIPDYIVTNLVPDQQRTVQLTMIADTFPVPVPATDIWGPDSPSGMVNWALATYEYLVGNDTAVELDYAVSSSFGHTSNTNLTVLGVGVQTELSIDSVFSTLASEVQQTCRASSLSVTTKGTPPAPGADGIHLSIAAEGAYFGMTPPGRIGVDAYLVLPRNASKHSDVAMVGVHPDISDTASLTRNGDYHAYCYTPGNLLTYDPGTINERMRSLYERLSSTNKQRFVIDGEDYGRLYTSGRYLDDVVAKFGSHNFGPSGGLPYLEFSFSETAIRRSEFQSTSGFTDGGTTYVNASWYVGAGWDQTLSSGLGVAAGVFGEISLNLFGATGFSMVGTQFSSTLETRNSQSSTWGLRLGEFLNPLGMGESYTVRMYLLKPSRLWSLEMALFGGAGNYIDVDGSAPVRILFTVPYVSDSLKARMSALPR